MIICKHEGNLRLFDNPPPWQDDYAETLGQMVIFAENALGAQYCRDPKGFVFVLDPETRSLNETDGLVDDFLALIDSDPHWAIDQGFYERCVLILGPVAEDEHYAFVIPIAMGGEMTPANVSRMSARTHMAGLAKISKQIQNDMPGTMYHPV